MAKILVVDDERETAQLVAIILEKEGHQVVQAHSGPAALDVLHRALTPDLILSDVTMPDMDGYTFVSHLQSEEGTRDIPVVMLTGRDGMKETFQLFTNVLDFISKPFDAKELRTRVQSALAKRPPR
jgi:CheY-like chemotaxis protein